MNIQSQTIRKHLRLINDYRLASLVVLFSFGLTVWYGIYSHKPLQGIGYVFVVWFGAFVTDMITDARPLLAIGFPIKKPVKWELLTILVCTTLGVIFLVIRFHGSWETMKPLLKLLLIPLILFTFPIVLALIYLFRYKYKPWELGVNVQYWYVALIIHFIVGGVTLWLAPGVSHWKEAFRDMGILNMLFVGLVSAALPEEFLRLLLQTRLGKAFNNIGLGFVAASFIWAAMHIPSESQHEKIINWTDASIRTATLMPIGFLWGYVTHRTKSLIPSVLIHGFNLWGLQNMM